MSVRKLTASVIAVLVIVTSGATAHAQGHFPPVDPFAFDPDFRWFEPVDQIELSEMKPEKRANYGWFSTYDRLALYASRPETDEPSIAESKLDRGWGHRYEVGYMLPDEDKGWAFTWTDYGVGEFFTVQRESLMRYNGDQVIGGSGGGFPVAPPFGRIVTQAEANTLGYDSRFYFIQDTENVMSIDSYELNRTWRMTPYHYGGILEPMIGIRWMRLKDVNAFQDYQSTFEFPPLTGPFGAAEQVTTNTAVTENEMLAAQLGFRYFKFKDRFTYSGQFRAFAGGNWQCSESQITNELYVYNYTANTVTIGAPLQGIELTQTTPIYSRNEEFFVGCDLRADLSYNITKMFAVRTGFTMMYVGKGVWRGGDGSVVEAGDNDQDIVLAGLTFGIELNR